MYDKICLNPGPKAMYDKKCLDPGPKAQVLELGKIAGSSLVKHVRTWCHGWGVGSSLRIQVRLGKLVGVFFFRFLRPLVAGISLAKLSVLRI